MPGVAGPSGALVQAQWLGEPPAISRHPLPRVGITVGELVGWRIWRVRSPDTLLVSYSADRIWLPGEPMEGTPSDYNGAGVWAFKDADRAAAKCGELSQAALGSVRLWGEVIEHQDGYRAQFAEVRSIDWAGPESVRLTPSYDTPVNITLYRFTNRRGDSCVSMRACDEDLLARLRRRYGVGDAAAADAAEAGGANAPD